MKMAHIPSAVNLAKSLQNGTAELKKKVDEPTGNGHTTHTQPLNHPNGQEPVSDGNASGRSMPAATAIPAVTANTTPVVKENNNHSYTPTAATKATVKIPLDLGELEEKIQPAADKTKVSTVQEVLARENIPFSQEQLENCWKAFAQSRITDGGYNSEQVILNKPIELNGTTILLKLDSQTQMGQLNEFKPALLEYLRKNLRNFSIDLQAEIAPQEAKKMIYTSQEKFKYLAEKHPVLQDLKTRLGLDLEF
jgi:DNA polymerase-3 subunit gamma/tau